MNKIKLICFDLDQTLITHSSWKELSFALGISYEEDRRLYKEYKAGLTTYNEWNNKLLDQYKKHDKADRKNITEILSRYTYVNGVKEIVEYLKEKGYILVLISGSIDILVDMIAKDLEIPYAKAYNTFVFDKENRLQGIYSEGGDDTSGKSIYLENLCNKLGINIKECACVADGANDIEMFRKTGHGITFKGSPIESEAWQVIDSLNDLENIL